MPILHLQFIGQTTDAAGKVIDLPPSTVLVHRGPCVQVSIGLAKSFAEPLLLQGHSVPAPASGMALIDTGATCTCIDDELARRLGLPVIDVCTIASASHEKSEQNVYPALIELIGASISIDAPRAVGAALASQGIVALIGRDMLQHCLLFYNGISGELTLAAG